MRVVPEESASGQTARERCRPRTAAVAANLNTVGRRVVVGGAILVAAAEHVVSDEMECGRGKVEPIRCRKILVAV
jgi:hypothetical protein